MAPSVVSAAGSCKKCGGPLYASGLCAASCQPETKETPLLTYAEIAARFPVEGVIDSEQSWAKLLMRLREDKKIWQRRGPDDPRWHFRYTPGPHGAVRKYNLHAIVLVIVKHAQGEQCYPLMSYLCDTYYKEFCDILKALQSLSKPSSVAAGEAVEAPVASPKPLAP